MPGAGVVARRRDSKHCTCYDPKNAFQKKTGPAKEATNKPIRYKSSHFCDPMKIISYT